MPATNPDKPFSRALEAQAVQSSNNTSNYFLGSSRKPWTVNGAAAQVNNTVPASQSQSLSRTINPVTVSEKPEVGRSITAPPDQPLNDHATIEVVHRAYDSGGPPISRGQAVGVADMSSQPLPGPPSNAADLDGLSVSGATTTPARIQDGIHGLGVVTQRPESFHLAQENINRNGRDSLRSDALASTAIMPDRSAFSPLSGAVGGQNRPPPTLPSDTPETFFLRPNPNSGGIVQNAMSTSVSATNQRHSPLIVATPTDHRGSGRKRPADAGLLAERRVRPRMNSDEMDLQKQLPTPQDSPITATTALLSELFESALSTLRTRSLTTDLSPVIDHQRIAMMRDACQRNDHFFMLTHVVFCLWSVGHVRIISQLKLTETHVQGMNTLVSVLGSNRKLTIELLNLFIAFPRSPEDLIQDRSQEFMVLMEEVRCFLFHLATGFLTLRDAARTRNCPPCSAELKFSLKLPSPVLQSALFTFILWQDFHDQAWLPTAHALFCADMLDPAGSVIGIAELNAYHGAQLNEIVPRWALTYRRRRKQYESEKSAIRGMPQQTPGFVNESHPAHVHHGSRPISSPPIVNSNAQGFHHPSQSMSTVPTSAQPPSQIPQTLNPAGIHQPFHSGLHPSIHHHAQRMQSQNGAAQNALLANTSNNHRVSHPVSHSRTHPIQPQTPISASLPPKSYQNQAASSILQTPIQPTFHDTQGSSLSPNSEHVNSRVASHIALPQTPSTQLPQISPVDAAIAIMGPNGVNDSSTRRGRGRPRKPEAILAERNRDGVTEFLVRFASNSTSDSWVPEHYLRSVPSTTASVGFNVATSKPSDKQYLGELVSRQHESPALPRKPVGDPRAMPSFLLQQNSLNTQPPKANQRSPSGNPQASNSGSQQRQTSYTDVDAHGFRHGPVVHTPPNVRQPGHPPVAIVRDAHGQAAPAGPLANGQQQPRTSTRPSVDHTDATTLEMQTALDALGEAISLSQTTPFFNPNPNFILPQYSGPNPDRIALHQVGLRSPEYHRMSDVDGETSNVRFYQYVEDLIALPEPITKDSDLIRWSVHIRPEIWVRRVISLPPVGDFGTRKRKVAHGDAQFRLKSVVFTEPTGWTRPTVSEICTRPAKWPKCLSVSVNEHEGLDFRRKAHYGTDLASDITEMLQEGENKIVLGAFFTPQEANWKFWMVVEIIRVVDHDRLVQMPARISAAESLRAITNTLKKPDDNDDDLIIDQPMVSIDLVDPFTSVMWVTPVRGQLCLHRECFDLEAFLLSRTSTEQAGDYSMSSPDKWHCPICKSDCRPTMLVLDEFLLAVRQTLEERAQLQAKAIKVREDGSWVAKVEPISNEEDRETPDAETGPSLTRKSDAHTAALGQPKAESVLPAPVTPLVPQPPPGHRTVIVLDDDDD